MSSLSLALPRIAHGRGNEESSLSAKCNERASHSGTVPSRIEFSIVRDRPSFDALEQEWNALFDRASSSHQLFQSFNWLWHWCNHYLDEKNGTELYIVTGRIGAKLVMIWPLVKENRFGVTEIAWMGDPMSQYGDVIAEQAPETDEWLERAWTFIKKNSKADVLRLRKVRADARVALLLEKLKGVITERHDAPYLDLASAPNFAEYEKRYSSGARRNRKRLFRRLDEQGKVAFEDIETGPRAREIVEVSVALKRRWLNSRGLVSKAFADDRITAFFSDALDTPSKPTGCRIALLTSAGRPAAIEIAVRCRDRIALHIIGFDLEFEKRGAGILLLEQSIRNAANDGISCYDLLAPGDNYKLDWADGTVAVNDWAIPLSLKGRAYTKAYIGFLRERIKAGHAALPASIRRALSLGISRFAALA